MVRHGLKAQQVESGMIRLAKPTVVPDGWTSLAAQTAASLWTYVVDPEGEGMWLRTFDGHTQLEAPYVIECSEEKKEAAGAWVPGVLEAEIEPTSQAMTLGKKIKKPPGLEANPSPPLPLHCAGRRKEVSDFQGPIDSSLGPPVAKVDVDAVKAKAEPVATSEVLGSKKNEWQAWKAAVEKEYNAFVEKQALGIATLEDLQRAEREGDVNPLQDGLCEETGE